MPEVLASFYDLIESKCLVAKKYIISQLQKDICNGKAY